MRFKKAGAVVLAGIVAVTASYGQAQRTSARDADARPCQLVIQNIERQLDMLESGLERLTEYERIAPESQKQRIADLRGTYSSRRDELSTDFLQSESDSDCRRLTDLSQKLTSANRDIINSELQIRQIYATAKRVKHAIDLTDRAVFKAAQLAKKTGNMEDAFAGLRRAFELQEEAKQALVSGRLEAAMKMTLRARDLVGRTVKEALDSADVALVRQRVIDFWKQTNVMIKRIEGHINSESNPKAARLLDMATREQERARELAEDHPYRAVRNARNARRIVSELIRFHQSAKNCDERSGRLAAHLDEAKNIVENADNEKASEMLQKAVEHYESGVELCGQGDAAKATAQFDIALKLGAKAVDIAKGTTAGGTAVNKEIRKTEVIVKRAGDIATTDEQKAAVEKAQALVEKAKQNAGNPKLCLQMLDAATDIAFGVIARANRGDADQQIEE